MKFDHSIDSMRDDIVKSTQEIIAFNSIEDYSDPDYPFGKAVNDTLCYTLNLAKNLGFTVKNLDNMVGYAEIGTGSEIIGVLVHLDIVPAGDNWSTDPFGGEIIDGKIYGRGTGDDKGPAIASLYAIKAIIDSGVTLDKRIRVIFGLNEETEWKSIQYYVDHEELPSAAIVPDSAFPVVYGEKGVIDFTLVHPFEEELDDGGIEVIELKGGQRPNMVPDYAEALIRSNISFEHILKEYNIEFDSDISMTIEDDNLYRLISKGISAHGARPHLGKNALAHLINLLDKLDLRIGDKANFIRVIARHIGLDYNGENIGCPLEDEISGKLTFNAGVSILNDQTATLSCNIRYPITCSYDEVVNGIIESIGYSKFEFQKNGHNPPLHVDKDSDFVKTLLNVYRDYTDDQEEPKTIGGATYARSMPNAVSFGALFPWRKSLAHQKDEYIHIDDLILITKIYAKALYELAK
jgi:succinyl-diaminopimelate desuccinylase